MLAGAKQDFAKSAWRVAANIDHRDEKHLCSNQSQVQGIVGSGGQSTQIKYLSKSTDTYNKILLQ